MIGFVDDLISREPDLDAVNEWYLLLHSSSSPIESEPLQPIESGAWGRFYKLYRIR